MKQSNKVASFFRYEPRQQESVTEQPQTVDPGERETELLDSSMRMERPNAKEATVAETELLQREHTGKEPKRQAPHSYQAREIAGSWQFGPVNVIDCTEERDEHPMERISESSETVLLDGKAPIPSKEQAAPEDPGETELLSRSGALLGEPENGETVLLDDPGVVRYSETCSATVEEDGHSAPVLVRLRTGERFVVNKRVFRIGTDRAGVDCWIRGNRAISRHHAEIIRRKGRYYIHDTNSLNFTYLNHVMIQANQEYLLHNYESIIFGNEEFRFEW